jgi:predicted ATPase
MGLTRRSWSNSPELWPIAGLSPAPPLDPAQEKRRLFHALAQFFTRLAARHSLLIVIEDVHWSDETSLEFLLLLARRIAALPVLLLLTYRSDEQHEALGHALATLERERLLVEWPLTPLRPDEVDGMIRAIFDLETPVRAEFLEAICSLTEGNPFFIEEVLKSLVASGDIFYADGTWDRKPMSELRIPRSVQDAVRVRTAQLSTDAQRVLIVAAVTGRRFDFGLLQRVVQHDEPELLRLVKEMIGAQLVVEDTADHFAFRHALTQQVIYSGLLARERRSPIARSGEHAATVRRIARRAPPELAHHLRGELVDEA